MRPIRTAKTAAGRVDPSYVRRSRRGALVLLTVLALAASVAWWAVHQTRGNATLYSPGRVATVHAAMDSDCRMCHDQDGRGGFLKHVSDSACLKCHKDEATAHSTSQSTMVQKIALTDHPLLSADCASCHIEHRGHEALLARNDTTCLQCHRDVVKFTKGSPHIQPNVTQFAMHEHPQFGRELTTTKTWSASPGALSDPTPLIFSHAKHVVLADIKTKAGEKETCTVCHEPPSPVASGIGVKPDQRYMQPVNFEKHCQSCHQLEVISGKGTPIPHVKLDLIRPLLDAYVDRNDYYLRQFAGMSPKDQKAALAPPAARRGATLTPVQWVQKNVDGYWDTVRTWLVKNDKSPRFDSLRPKAGQPKPPTTLPSELRTASTLEYYVVHNNTDKCAFCHKLSDDAAAGLAGPATSPASAPTATPGDMKADTLPTGITSAPRRWYVNSTFDHSAHRFDRKTNSSIACAYCHGDGSKSDDMTTVLLPGIESCVSCHHPPDKNGPGATDSCLSCHPFYHNRSGESVTPKLW